MKLTQTAATPYTGRTQPTNSTLLTAPDASTMAEQMHPQQPSHDDTMRKKFYLRDFKKMPNQNSIDIPMQTSKALFVTNLKLKIIDECTSRLNMP